MVYVLVQFEVVNVKEDPEKPRPHLNLSIVLDRSGSMSDKGKIEYAKKSAKFLVDYMKRTDILSIVEYDDRITVL